MISLQASHWAPPPLFPEVFPIRRVDCPCVRFRIVPACSLKTRRCSVLDAWIIPAFYSGSAPHTALKTSRCSGLDAWIVPAFCCGLPPRGALKTRRCSRLDAWIVPAFCSGSSPHRALKTGRFSKSDQHVLFIFLTKRYYPHNSRDSVSHV